MALLFTKDKPQHYLKILHKLKFIIPEHDILYLLSLPKFIHTYLLSGSIYAHKKQWQALNKCQESIWIEYYLNKRCSF